MAWWDPTTWFGSGGSGSTRDDPSTFPTPPIPATGATPYTGGTPYDPTAATPSDWTGGGSSSGQPLSQKLADALGQLSKPGQVQQNQAPQQARLNTSAQIPQSTFSRGGSENLSTLVQMLLSRANQYGPPTASSSSGRGLLGT